MYSQRQSQSFFSYPAIAVATIILRTQKSSHRVSVRIVKLYAIKPGHSCSLCSCSKNGWQLLRELFDMWQVSISNTLTITKAKGLKFSFIQHVVQDFVGQCLQNRANITLRRIEPPVVVCRSG